MDVDLTRLTKVRGKTNQKQDCLNIDIGACISWVLEPVPQNVRPSAEVLACSLPIMLNELGLLLELASHRVAVSQQELGTGFIVS